MVTVISRFRVANGLEAAVRDAFVARPRLVDAAPGFLGLETFTDARQPDVFYLVTRWMDELSYTTWHGSADHRHSHAWIPKGLKLDPSFTTVTVGQRIERAGDAPHLETTVADSPSLLTAFLAHSASTYCLLISADGTIRLCNNAVNELLGLDAPGAAGRPLATFLTESDAAHLAAHVAAGHAGPMPMLLNFVTANGMPFTLRCRIAVQGDQAVIVGEPDNQGLAALQQQLVDLNNQLSVFARENARQKRELEQSHWHLQKIGDLLPICVECGKVKTSDTAWEDLRTYFQGHSEFLSHGYCPGCAVRLAREWGIE